VLTPEFLRHQYTKPEQSKVFGPLAPRTYLLPSLLSASATSFSTPVLLEALATLPDELELEELLLEELLELELSLLVEGDVTAFFALEEFIMVSVTAPTLPS
jgi:hypothetical protein